MICTLFKPRNTIRTKLKKQYYIERTEDDNRRTWYQVKRINTGFQVGRDFQNIEAAEDFISEIVNKRLGILFEQRKRNRNKLRKIGINI